MAQWWNGMTVFQQVSAVIAMVATALLVVQIILLLIGLGHSADVDVPEGTGADFDDAINGDFAELGSLKVLTVRGAICFLAIGGWVAVCFNYILPEWASGLIGIAAGALTAFLLALALRAFNRFEANGNIELGKVVGKTGTVYIPVPAKGNGKGKINLVVDDKLIEVDAVNESEELLSTGSTVEVTARLDETTLVVKSA